MAEPDIVPTVAAREPAGHKRTCGELTGIVPKVVTPPPSARQAAGQLTGAA